ncbi:MAG: substrate-binding domain-containing protein [Kiritimatiellae bacterium]|nr:substrate-binding domain-containing protein [Kiritimatiellia bacterium]
MSKLDEVTGALVRRVRDGGLAKGARLPTMRTLAAENGVSVYVAKKAMDRLIEAGVVESRVGDGCYITDVSGGALQRLSREVDARLASEERRQLARRAPAPAPSVAVLISETRSSFTGAFLNGITSVLTRESYRCVLALSGWSAQREALHVQSFLADPGIRGIIVDAVNKREAPFWLPDVRRTRTPTVVIGDAYYPEGTCLDVIRNDSRAGMRMAMKHVLSLGHRRIAYLEFSMVDAAASQVRYETYCACLRERGLEPMPRVALSGGAESERMAVLEPLFSAARSRPSALVSFDDTLVLWAIHALAALGLRVPDDVSVCGYDDREMVDAMTPALTTVHYPREEIGKLAAERVLGKVAGTIPIDDVQEIEIEPRLVVRESCVALRHPDKSDE